MSKFVLINSKVPICPECNSKPRINLVENTVKCQKCMTIYSIIELGRNERDFICERKKERAYEI